VALAVIVAAAAEGPAVRAAVELAEILAVAVASVVVIATVVAVLVWRSRRKRRRAAAELAPRPVVLAAVAEPARLGSRQVPAAIEPPHADVSAYSRVHAEPYVVTSRAVRPRCAHRGERRS
jgi:hypothetical protein